MNITSMSSGEPYKTLSGQEAAVHSLLDVPEMQGKIKAVFSLKRDLLPAVMI